MARTWLPVAAFLGLALTDNPVRAAGGGMSSTVLGLAGLLASTSAIALYLVFHILRRTARERAKDTEIVSSAQIAFETMRMACFESGVILLVWSSATARCVVLGGRLAGTTVAAIAGVDDLARYFSPEDFAALQESCERLRTGGAAFRRLYRLHDGTTIAAEGKPSAGGAVVWLRDASTEAQALDTLETRLAQSRTEATVLGTLLKALGVPLWRRNQAFELIWCNEAYAAAIESTIPAALAPPGIELLSKFGGTAARALAERARASGEVVRERHHAIIQGERRLMEVVERPDPSGHGTIGWAHDLTELESANNQLSRHLSAHAEVLESLSSAISIYGPNMRLTFFNAEFVKLYRLDEAMLRSEPTISEVIDAMRESRRLPEEADWRAYKQRRMRLFTSVTEPQEELLHLPDGSTFRSIITPHPLGGLLFIAQDVTDRLALERSHSTLTAVQRATLDNLYEAVAVFGADGRLKLSNPGFAALWGLPPGRLQSEPHASEILTAIEPLFDPEDFERHRRELLGQFSERVRSNQHLLRKDDKVLECAFVPLPDGATLVTYVDITDSFQVEQALRERTEALETAGRLKSEFVANVSYELRTPLNTVIGFSEILVNQFFGTLNERQLEYGRAILESSQHLLALINDILDLATIEAGLIVLERELVDVHSVVLSMATLVQERTRKQHLTLVLDCPQEIGGFNADERRLKQVLFNLLSNAFKFTPPGGMITLGAQRKDSTIELWVSDTGIGIEREEQNRVFDKFYRTNSALARRSGAGLGLSLVKYFVELHGGHVVLESQAKEGTTVRCIFPADPVLVEPASEPQ